MGVKRIAILTGGGDCPGLNGVIRAAVRAATREHKIEVIGVQDGFEGLAVTPARVRRLEVGDVRGLLPRGGTVLGTSNRANPFAFPVKAGGRVVLKDVSRAIIKRLRNLGVEALIVVGGDGSLSIAHEMGKLGVRVVGVPKTIDNDLSATDVTFGFDTAVATAVDALDKLHTTAESHHRVMILEVMGRNAGWIALHAGVAGGADVILLPEFPYDIRRVVAKIDERARHNCHFSIIVVAEGAFPAGGRVKTRKSAVGALARLVGAGERVATELKALHGGESRVTVLGHVQRGGSPSAFDRVLSTRFGAAAVEAVVRERFGTMVALRGAAIEAVPLADAVGVQKRVNADTELLRVAQAIGIEVGATRH
jgi:6-phosphofructokinase 1